MIKQQICAMGGLKSWINYNVHEHRPTHILKTKHGFWEATIKILAIKIYRHSYNNVFIIFTILSSYYKWPVHKQNHYKAPNLYKMHLSMKNEKH